MLLRGCRSLALWRLRAARVVRLRGRRGRWTFLASAQQLLNVLVILLAEHAGPLLPLEEQIVRSCDIIEAVPFDLLLGLVCVDIVVVDQHAHDLSIDRDGFLAEVDRRRVRWLVLADGVPRVVSNILDRVALRRVRIQDIADQVLGLLG